MTQDQDAFYLKSMTGFGSASVSFLYGVLNVEIHSVNRRFLEVQLVLPGSLKRFETQLRKKVALFLGRGTVSFHVTWKREAKYLSSVEPNLTLAKALQDAYETIGSALKIDSNVNLQLLAEHPDLLMIEEKEIDASLLEKALEQATTSALTNLVEVKMREGQELAEDLYARTFAMQEALETILSHAPQMIERLHHRLSDRLKEYFNHTEEHTERILREVAIYAEKMDISEELVRFQTHIKQLRLLLQKPLENALECRGRTLDFFIQELNREINTIGSKATACTPDVIKIKCELEKMREQVQNIE